jgi:histidine kinase
MSWWRSFFYNLQTRFIWKLMASYLIVVLVGIITLALSAESVVPTAFNRHIAGMGRMMSAGMQTGMGTFPMHDDLFAGFRFAVTEALLVAAASALVSAIAMSVFVSRRVVTPIRRMMAASRHIADGSYHERVQVVSRDELGQLARSFNQMAAGLEQTETMRRELVANVAHELRTPLTTIKGYMEGLLDGVLPPETATFQQIYREADRLQRLVSDLQELSRVEAGAFELHCQPLSIPKLIRQITTRLRPQFEEKSVALELILPDNLPPVQADEDRINQVLLNLLGNALQYTPSGGRVTVFAAAQAGTVQVSVRDTGLGIPVEHLPHLFSRFYRVDKSRSRVGGGSGIGLTIAKHLVEAHSGCIWAESEGVGRGSAFSFTLHTPTSVRW